MEKLKSIRYCHPKIVIFTLVMALFVSITDTYAQVGVEDATYQVAVLQYRGGGDWYSNPTSVPNLILHMMLIHSAGYLRTEGTGFAASCFSRQKRERLAHDMYQLQL